MAYDLDTLSLKELKDLQSQVTKMIANFEVRQKQTALNALEEKAREMGFSLAELTGVSIGRKKSAPSAAKFANPEDREQTWSGRGRKPRWFEAALASGKTEDDLAV